MSSAKSRSGCMATPLVMVILTGLCFTVLAAGVIVATCLIPDPEGETPPPSRGTAVSATGTPLFPASPTPSPRPSDVTLPTPTLTVPLPTQAVLASPTPGILVESETGANDSPAGADSLAYGQTVQGCINSREDRDFYGFYAHSDDWIVFRMSDQDIEGRIRNNRLEVFNAAGESLGQHDPYYYQLYGFSVAAIESGRHYILVESYEENCYTLELNLASRDSDDTFFTAPSVDPGETVEGILSCSQDVDRYRILEATNAWVSVELRTPSRETTFFGEMVLAEENGSRPATAAQCEGGHQLRLRYPLESGKIYYITVQSGNAWNWMEAGLYEQGYALDVELIQGEPDDADSARDIAFGGALSGMIELDGDADYYTFSGTRGEDVEVAVRAAIDGSSVDCALEIQDADGTTLISNDDFAGPDPFIAFTLPQNGTYFIVVSGRLSTNYCEPAPDYTLQLNRAP